MDMELEQLRGEVQRLFGKIQDLEQQTKDRDQDLKQVRAEITRLLGHHPSDALKKLVELASEESGDAAASIQEGADSAEPPSWVWLALNAASDYDSLRAKYGQLAQALTAIQQHAQRTNTGVWADILKMIADAPAAQPTLTDEQRQTLAFNQGWDARAQYALDAAPAAQPELSADEKQALQWALGQDFQSVAARYARTLAKLAQRLGAEVA